MLMQPRALTGRSRDEALRRFDGQGYGVLKTGVAEAVIGCALLRILQGLVGLADLLELLLGFMVAGILVRMEFQRQLAIRLLYLVRRGRLRHAERDVERVARRR